MTGSQMPSGSAGTNRPTPPSGLQIFTPPEWWDLPLDPATRRRDLVELVERRAPEGMGQAERDELRANLEEAAAAAAASGAVIASQVGVVGPGLAFGASVMVAVSQTEARSIAELERDVTEMPVELGVADRDVEVTGIDFDAGPAVRRRAIRTFPNLTVWEGTPEVVSVQYFVLLPGAASVVVVACGSPNTDAVEEMTSLFDAIAGTLRFFGPEGG